MKIENIQIKNIRGIKQAIDFPLKKGNSATSLVIYGKNGTGKSSIVDAWEWLYESKILHLSREGAGIKDYPHMDSDGADSYIELTFKDETVENLKIEYNKDRITQPIINGDYNSFKKLIPHPCHLRYKDLQRFVYFTKTEKYEYLAKYLGFEEALLVQKDIQKYYNSLLTRLKNKKNKKEEYEKQIVGILGEEKEPTEENLLRFINNILKKYELNQIEHFTKVKPSIKKLEKLIKDNPKAQKLREWRSFEKHLSNLFPTIGPIQEDIKSLEDLFKELKKDEEKLINIARIDLYETGLDIVESQEDRTICPLCDQKFDGNLENHISDKHKTLASLKEKSQEFNSKRQIIQKSLRGIKGVIESLKDIESEVIHKTLSEFFKRIDCVFQSIDGGIETLDNKITKLDKLELTDERWFECIEILEENKEEIIKITESNIKSLSDDEQQKSVVEDYSKLKELSGVYYHFELKTREIDYFEENYKESFEVISEEYNEWVKRQIQKEFENISDDMITYFNTLENNHEYIQNPKIKLIDDHNKAVELEIEFAGENLSPAFKVLSESQVNSFGLAVFLSAIKNFNADFKFIILDDVINSFDAYKRPRVITLLKDYFDDYQILALTHDQIWYDRLIKKFPRWNRLRFTGWDYKTGPKVKPGESQFEKIQNDLDDDEPVYAGQKLGRYLEWVLQILNECFETPIRYRQNNQYALNELFTCFRVRIGKKLKTNHKVYKLLQSFEEDTIFRNYCAHWKGGNAFTSEEIQAVFDKWQEIEEMLTCEDCRSFPIYKSDSIKCCCGDLDMNDEKFKVN